MRQSFRFLSCTLLNLALAAYALPVALAGEATVPAVLPAATVAALVWTMPEVEKKELLAVVERAIAAGFPDAKGGTFMYGSVAYKVKSRELMMVNYWEKQETKYEERKADGLHLRLADGRLLMNLRWLMPTTGTDAVDISKLEIIAPDKLIEFGAKHLAAQQQSIDDEDAWNKAHYAESELPKLRAIRAVSGLRGLTYDSFSAAMAMLRMQVPQAELVALENAVSWLWNRSEVDDFAEGRQRPLSLMTEHMNHSEMYIKQMNDKNERRIKRSGLRLPSVVSCLRKEAVWSFINSLYDEEMGRPMAAMTPSPQQSRVAALALIDDVDVGSAALRQLVGRLEMRLSIPAELTLKSGLFDIFRWGDGSYWLSQFHHVPESRYTEEETAELFSRFQNKELQQVIIRMVAPLLQQASVSDLIDLVGDQGVSRWVESLVVHSIGDNALRALAYHFGCDPRVLIGRDPLAPWTQQEALATARALQDWWQTNQKKPLAELLSGAIDKMRIQDVARLVVQTKAEDRISLFGHIAKLWSAVPPIDPDPVSLAQILFADKLSHVLDSVIATWPVAGRPRALLAAWHEEHDNSAPINALLNEYLKPEKMEEKGDWKIDLGGGAYVNRSVVYHDESVIDLISWYPTLERLQRLMAADIRIGDHDLGSLMAERLVSGRSRYFDPNPELMAWWDLKEDPTGRRVPRNENEPEKERRARLVVRLTHMGLLLGNQNPAPEELVKSHFLRDAPFLDSVPVTGKLFHSQKEKAVLPPADLRIADIAAYFICDMSSESFSDFLGVQQKERSWTRFSLNDTKAVRDKIIAIQRALIASALPPALEAANFPIMIPGVTDVDRTSIDNDVPLY